jgi:hypothetical protein
MSSKGHGNQVPAGQAEESSALDLAGLEHQQALLLSALRRAAGAPVTYAELRDAGIEFPAGVVSELELAGVPIQRCHGGDAGAQRAPAVRLDLDDPGPEVVAAAAPERPEPADVSGWDDVRVYRTATGGAVLLAALDWLSRTVGQGRRAGAAAVRAGRGGARVRRAGGGVDRTGTGADRTGTEAGRARGARARARWVAPAALLAAIALVAAFLLIGSSGGGGRLHGALTHRPPPKTVASAGASHAASPPRPAGRVAPTPVSPALATDLEARGHGLLETGQYGDAVLVLRRAVLATGERISACLEPDSSTCLTYAYALYDLGRALRLSGDAAAAVPILERRLRIDNQRSTVQAELQLARQGVT